MSDAQEVGLKVSVVVPADKPATPKKDIQRATLGRIVLYTFPPTNAKPDSVRPAIITSVKPGPEETCDLTVFLADGDGILGWTPKVLAPHDENGAVGTWKWPPRV